MKKYALIVLFIIGIVAVSGCLNGGSDNNRGSDSKLTGEAVTIYKSSTCGCCVGYATELDNNGFDVKTINSPDLNIIKQKYNIPQNLRSCHTAVIGNYFVEGHIPLEAVNKLLEEKPDIDGIALPGMPSGSPGMPGSKTEPWVIYAIKDGEASEFMTI